MTVTYLSPLSSAGTSDRRLLAAPADGIVIGTRVVLDGSAASTAQHRLARQYAGALVSIVPSAVKAAM